MNIKIFFVVGVPTFGEGGGVKPVGTKSQVWPKILSDGSPYSLTSGTTCLPKKGLLIHIFTHGHTINHRRSK